MQQDENEVNKSFKSYTGNHIAYLNGRYALSEVVV